MKSFAIRYIDRFKESFNALEAFQRQLGRVTLENLLAKERALRVRLHIAQTGSEPLEAALKHKSEPNEFHLQLKLAPFSENLKLDKLVVDVLLYQPRRRRDW